MINQEIIDAIRHANRKINSRKICEDLEWTVFEDESKYNIVAKIPQYSLLKEFSSSDPILSIGLITNQIVSFLEGIN